MDILEFGDQTAGVVLLQPADQRETASMEEEAALIRKETGREFRLLVFQINDWNRELSPWEAPALFGREGFGGEAGDTLREIIKHCEDRSKTYFLGGYSLAGLFALWAAYQTELFRGIAAASPSLWFPGFSDFMAEREMKSPSVYLSLGDREEKARNPVLASVGEELRRAHALLKKQGVNCVLQWNEGNHFQDVTRRTAKAFCWILNSCR